VADELIGENMLLSWYAVNVNWNPAHVSECHDGCAIR
jgi:hypothetical protein